MRGIYHNVKVCGIAGSVPKGMEDNESYIPTLGEKRIKKHARMTGVEQRRICEKEQTVVDLCECAAEKLLDSVGWDQKAIKVVVLVTQSPAIIIPSTAFILHKRLGLDTDCMVFDVNLGCTGYVAGLQIVSGLLQGQPAGTKGLLLTGEVINVRSSEDPSLTPENRASMMLFGSGGSATALEVQDHNDLYFMEESDGSRYTALLHRFDGAFTMDGVSVFDFSINEVPDSLRKFKDYFHIREETIDYYVFHQAQKLILGNIGKLCDIDPEKILTSLERYGNTSSASIPLTICQEYEKMRQKKVRTLVLCGFGIGLAWGSVKLELPTDSILPIVETDVCCGER